MEMRIAAMAGVSAAMLSACSLSEGQQQGGARSPAHLAQPSVVMEADPAPPFTYWAAEGSTLRNHPRQAGIWIGEVAGQRDRYYFGDQCQASRYQQFVGRPLAEMPSAPQGAVWRKHCSSCAVTQDLAMTRMNISFDEKSQRIDAIACGG
jgi:hypothetical protein